MLLIQDDRKKITVSWYFTYYDLTFFSQYVIRYNYSTFYNKQVFMKMDYTFPNLLFVVSSEFFYVLVDGL